MVNIYLVQRPGAIHWPRLGETLMRLAFTSANSLALLFCLGACGPALPDYDYSKEPDPRDSEYVLGVSDNLDINVWKNSEVSARVTIRPDGRITMPLIGDLQATGKTPSQLKQEIRRRLTKWIKLDGVEITIAVNNWASYSFIVSGEVNRPGIIESNRHVTVVEAIAMAGGLTRFAKKNQIVLTRTDPKTQKVRRIPLAYEPIVNGDRPDMNIVMIRGDTLHVP
ncbi:MAG: polysaccharide biosynthesis/export family protein [Proteobacteria bacterium]|nr:polysaccharide biosynthesis/export family protein [Pseudomonadota bacterium]